MGLTFVRKLRILAAIILFVMVSLAVSFFYSANRYSKHLKRMELTHAVLVGYLSVSNYAYLKINTITLIVENGEVDEVNEQIVKSLALQQTMDEIRTAIEAEVRFVDEDELDGELQELKHLVELELLAQQMTKASEIIIENVKNNDMSEAQMGLKLLRSDALSGQFYSLIRHALLHEREEATEIERTADKLNNIVGIFLPLTLALFIVLGAFITYVSGRKVTGSLSILADAAKAYESGNLDYRVQRFSEPELDELAAAFNRMAEQLERSNQKVLSDQQTLRDLVAERTRELEDINEQLSQADRQRSRFLADISHELRTPLTIIQGESEMALRGENKCSAEYKLTLTRVRDQVMHTARLVEDLLFVARAEEGHSRLDIRTLSVSELLNDSCLNFAALARDSGIEIVERHIGELSVDGDEGRLRQVLTVLLDNALRYSNRGDVITVSSELMSGFVKISIEDQGIGLSAEEAQQAFTRFYRGDGATKKSPGSGLGLPVAKAIVEAHMGTITLDGTKGKGAIAKICLPAPKSWGEVT